MCAKKWLAAASALLAAVSFGMTCSAADAPTAYNWIDIQEHTVSFFEGDDQKSASQPIRSRDVTIFINETSDLCVCFFDPDGIYRIFTLGKQTSLEMSGILDSLTILNGGSDSRFAPDIHLTSSGDVHTLTASSPGKVDIWGHVSTLNVMSDAQTVSIAGQVDTLNIVSAKEITIEKSAEIGAYNILDASVRISEFVHAV